MAAGITKIAGAIALVAGVGGGAFMGTAEPVAQSAPAMETAAPTRIEVDLSERTLYVHHDGGVMNQFDVAVGEPDHPTPKGSFQIDRIIWNPAWVPPNTGWAEDKEKKDPNAEENPMVGAKLFFKYPDYYIHGTDAEHTLGQAESHGCIRMAPEDVKALGEFVQTHGGEDRSGAWFDRVQDDDESKHEVMLPDPVPVEVHP